MNFKKTVWHIRRWILDLLIPPCCVVCGKVETWLCDMCASMLPLLTEPVCERCGQPWDGEGLCPRCRTSLQHIAAIRSAFLFEGHIRDVIHALKYRGGAEVAPLLGRRMAEAWQRYAIKSDLLVPVPLYPDRQLQRGYNQSALLALALSQEIGIPVSVQGLIRVRNTASQTKLNQEERRKNVAAAFACYGDVSFAGKHVTLVDDVATTGATLDACADVLLANQAKAVNAFTLARTS